MISTTREVARQLTTDGKLRAAINLSNFLLVTSGGSSGEPLQGVSPDIAHELGRRLSVPVSLVPYACPQAIANDASLDVWDIGNIGDEPQRAQVMDFTAAYCEIECTYLVPENSPLRSFHDIDQPGIRIASKGGGAYDLWLQRNIKNAEIIQADSLDGSFDAFVSKDLDALAGLRPRLVSDAERLDGARLLPGKFMSVQQAIGMPKGKSPDAVDWLRAQVEDMKRTGFVEERIQFHGRAGLLKGAGYYRPKI
uniref:Solute-binding protein family 3/N-terminal domain-containing protein n=1 Tax=Octactis speculum TaxID=3111310 RepID=A0A7S2H9C3_9STRA|mmetsp:Transcript_62572/g.85999  ORF Transcript_62572/g.85999 Transcript_62572/m.85999 type:complete len:252 (+) Transcript_62572:36-791(+)